LTTASEHFPTFQVLGVRVHLAPMDQVLNQIDEWIADRSHCRFVVATGMHGVMEARKRSDFRRIVNSADLFIPDGFSLVGVARLRGFKIKKRVCGTDLMWEACKRAEKNGHGMFFYGDTDETLKRLTSQLLGSFPRLKIAGAHSPPFRPLTPEEDQEEIKMINDSGADIVWVGLGLPKQEKWMFDHRERLSVPVLVGVGAAFKFLSGGIKRAPAWMGDHGLEWLWRFIHEPRQLWRRVLIDGPRFIFCVAWDSLDSKGSGKTK